MRWGEVVRVGPKLNNGNELMKIYCLYYVGENDYQDAGLVGVYSNMNAVKDRLLLDEVDMCMIETRTLDDPSCEKVSFLTKGDDGWVIDNRFQNREPGNVCDFIEAFL